MKILEFGCMHINKNIYIFYFFPEILKKTKYI
jgi:hypothetical protein